MNLNLVGPSSGLSLAGPGANLAGASGMGAWRWSTHDVHPLQTLESPRNISSSNPTSHRKYAA